EERRPLAVWYDTVTVVRGGNGEMLRRVQRIVREDGSTTVLVNEADRRTLLPRRTTARRDDGEPFIDLSFDGTRVEGRRPLLPQNGGPGAAVPVELSLDLPRPVYDWRWWGLLIAALPLDRGYEARMLSFATEATLPSPLLWITARVVGEEPVGRVECWVVEVDAGAPWTLWIARGGEAAPVQRIRVDRPDGAAVLWEPLSGSD
ncbi:MAG: hypothetical protein ACODAE_08265, partial [Gemmatimonadota bacterium]